MLLKGKAAFSLKNTGERKKNFLSKEATEWEKENPDQSISSSVDVSHKSPFRRVFAKKAFLRPLDWTDVRTMGTETSRVRVASRKIHVLREEEETESGKIAT